MLTLICGLPRAGKTTYSERFEKVIHLDDYIHLPMSLRYERCNKNAQTKEDVAVDGIYHTANLRIQLVRLYQGDGLKCVWLDTPLEIKKQRCGYVSAMNFHFEPPTLDEGWDEIIIIRGDDNVERISREKQT